MSAAFPAGGIDGGAKGQSFFAKKQPLQHIYFQDMVQRLFFVLLRGLAVFHRAFLAGNNSFTAMAG